MARKASPNDRTTAQKKTRKDKRKAPARQKGIPFAPNRQGVAGSWGCFNSAIGAPTPQTIDATHSVAFLRAADRPNQLARSSQLAARVVKARKSPLCLPRREYGVVD